jgi:hypothetical protein
MTASNFAMVSSLKLDFVETMVNCHRSQAAGRQLEALDLGLENCDSKCEV